MITKNHITGRCFRDGREITPEEYNRVLALMQNRPIAPAGYSYRFTENDEWELYELPDEPVESGDLTEIEQKARAYDVLTGVSE